ncbi:MAG: DUF460 domain-containing protein [Candidatus Woesearchaeota archaeon]
MKHYILGVDPGTNSAFALISLDGKIKTLFSKKNASVEEMIYEIEKSSSPGKILLCGCDKAKAPSNVELIAKKFNSKLIKPNHDLNFHEKKELFQSYCDDLKLNPHEYDALVSAFYVFKKIQSRINKAIKKIDENVDIEKFLELLLTTNKTIDQILNEIKGIEVEELRNIQEIKTINYNRISKIKTKEYEKEIEFWKNKFLEEKEKRKREINERMLMLTSKIYCLKEDLEKNNEFIQELLEASLKNMPIAIKENYNSFKYKYQFKDGKIYEKEKESYKEINAKILEEKKFIVVFEKIQDDFWKIVEEYKKEREKEFNKKF